MTGIDTDVKEVEKMFAVNVFGPMRMVRYFHPLIIRKGGKIVNIGSVGGIVPYVYGGKLFRLFVFEQNHPFQLFSRSFQAAIFYSPQSVQANDSLSHRSQLQCQ